ncbi:hypothetical protein VTL71DRAFT_750 [Oculimacula yallundae]|uniref:Uncharacterized protein n=1 Tax=Oculimacula yallundae TaxID=86028 RepID=A0ABR4D0Y7_9HELO
MPLALSSSPDPRSEVPSILRVTPNFNLVSNVELDLNSNQHCQSLVSAFERISLLINTFTDILDDLDAPKRDPDFNTLLIRYQTKKLVDRLLAIGTRDCDLFRHREYHLARFGRRNQLNSSLNHKKVLHSKRNGVDCSGDLWAIHTRTRTRTRTFRIFIPVSPSSLPA